MGKDTAIGWCAWPGYKPATWNPIAAFRKSDGKRGWHCEKVKGKPECAHCYASELNVRMGTGLEFTVKNREEVFFKLVNLDLPTRTTKPTCWFVNSMTDFFGEFVSDEQLHEMLAVMLSTQRHVYIILTKREQRMAEFLSKHYPEMANVPWIVWGTSAGTQKVYDESMVHLMNTPAALRLMSLEPLLEEVHLHLDDFKDKLNWLIVGGESGGDRRDCGPIAIASAATQCKLHDVPVFVKQDSARKPGQQGRIIPDVWSMKQFPKLKESVLAL